MIQSDPHVTLPALILQSVCIGILLIGCLLFLFIFTRSRQRLHLAVLLIGLFSLVHVGCDIMIILSAWTREPFLGMMFHSAQAFSSLYYIFGLPFLLSNLLEVNLPWNRINRVFVYSGSVFALAIALIALLNPDLYVSLTIHRDTWLINAWDYGRGQTGILYMLRDVWIMALFVYTFVSLFLDIKLNKSHRYTLLPLIGIFLAMVGAVDDIYYVYTRSRFTLFPQVYYSRFSLGLTLFIILTMIAIIIKFIDQARDVEKASKIESLGIFAGGIAHDFNNLLTAIVGNLSMAKILASREDDLHGILTDAEKATLRARSLTRQLLTFSKGGVPIKRTTSIRDLLTDTVNFILSGSHIKSDFSFSADLWDVDIDEDQMSQVINNLIINAMQSMPHGGKISISACNREVLDADDPDLEAGRYVNITITDQGQGIPEKMLKNIFDPYFTTKEMGSGLGLAVSYSIIKKHAGHITVSSKEGSGTTFRLFLPSSRERQDAVEKKIVNEEVSLSGRVLFMDDEEIIRITGKKMLTHIGFDVVCTKDGDETFEVYRREKENGRPFDLVIMDLTIPGGMGGREAIGRLRQYNPDVVAVASSGYSNDPVLARFTEYGFSERLTKPYQYEEMKAVLTRVLS